MVEARPHDIERIDFFLQECSDPIELLLKFGVGGEFPGHVCLPLDGSCNGRKALRWVNVTPCYTYCNSYPTVTLAWFLAVDFQELTEIPYESDDHRVLVEIGTRKDKVHADLVDLIDQQMRRGAAFDIALGAIAFQFERLDAGTENGE
ncbi:conserved hypothetical protein, partial [Ricinus communis]